jgi:hypothetical protein
MHEDYRTTAEGQEDALLRVGIAVREAITLSGLTPEQVRQAVESAIADPRI